MDETQRNQVQKRLSHARDSLKDAKALYTEGVDMGLAMNNLYYTFLYPVLGLLQTRQIPAPMQNSALPLFEREFVQKGVFDSRFLDAFRKASDLRPSCECQKNIASTDIEELLLVAQDFLSAVEKNMQQSA